MDWKRIAPSLEMDGLDVFLRHPFTTPRIELKVQENFPWNW
jgi:hypothetical protein